MHFTFYNVKTITQKANMETRQMTPFFSSTFSTLSVCNSHFCIWKQSKFIFMWSYIWSILVCKIPQFWEKLSVWTVHHTFLESIHSDVFKNLYYVLFPEVSQVKGISSWTINITKIFHFINSKNLLGESYATTAPDFWKMHLLVLLKMYLGIFL